MAIGYNWAEGSYADASWVVNAWDALSNVYTVALARVQAILGISRTHIAT